MPYKETTVWWQRNLGIEIIRRKNWFHRCSFLIQVRAGKYIPTTIHRCSWWQEDFDMSGGHRYATTDNNWKSSPWVQSAVSALIFEVVFGQQKSVEGEASPSTSVMYFWFVKISPLDSQKLLHGDRNFWKRRLQCSCPIPWRSQVGLVNGITRVGFKERIFFTTFRISRSMQIVADFSTTMSNAIKMIPNE